MLGSNDNVMPAVTAFASINCFEFKISFYTCRG